MTNISDEGKLFAMNTLDYGVQWAFWHVRDAYFLPVLCGRVAVH